MSHRHHAPSDQYAALTVGDCEFCGEDVALKDADPLLLSANSICHARCYAADRDAWQAWASQRMADALHVVHPSSLE